MSRISMEARENLNATIAGFGNNVATQRSAVEQVGPKPVNWYDLETRSPRAF